MEELEFTTWIPKVLWSYDKIYKLKEIRKIEEKINMKCMKCGKRFNAKKYDCICPKCGTYNSVNALFSDSSTMDKTQNGDRKKKNAIIGITIVIILLLFCIIFFCVPNRKSSIFLTLIGMSDTSEELIGTWELSCDIGSMLSDELGSEYSDFQSPLKVSLNLEFNENGTYKIYVDEDELKTSVQEWMWDFAGYGASKAYEQAGMDKEAVDQGVQRMYGCTPQEYIYKVLQENIYYEDTIGNIEFSGNYEAKGDKLYLSKFWENIDNSYQYDLFKVDGDTLTLSLADDSQDPEVLPGLDYPLVFTRQQ